jgi:predicted nucleotidyltransferase
MTAPLEQAVIQKIVEDISQNPRVAGIRLGGSRALGLHEPDSDYDFIIYFRNEDPFGNAEIYRYTKLSGIKPTDSGRRLQGRVDGAEVEFFYRNVRILSKALAEIKDGSFSLLPDRWFPQGILSFEPLSLLVHGKIIYDPKGELSEFKNAALPMSALFQSTLADFGHVGAKTALKNLQKARRLPDHVPYMMAHVFLFNWYVEITIFAINGIYPIHCKQTSKLISKMARCPPNYLIRIAEMYRYAVSDNPTIAFQRMSRLLEELGGI